ncbi:MAG TPA: DNA-protecting protein DprA [Crocinitomix sp.]|nr:DNA-protecting protein DprA [Crocinitomix sp.]
MSNRLYQIALSLLPNVGPIKAKTLVSYLGSAKAVVEAKPKDLSQIPGFSGVLLKNINLSDILKRAEKELVFIEKNSINCLYYQDENYPNKLKQAIDSPIIIYTKGNIDFNKKNIAVVGTRKATQYGKTLTQNLVKDFKELNVNIVSGLAYGIDIEAHQSALNHNISTIGVFARGLDVIYPSAHTGVAYQMLENGGWVTEFLSNTQGDPAFFVKRNRIVAGLCDATIIVESAHKGGSLITAGLANDYNRDVFAFPANVDREMSKGCNLLIQKNRAHLITKTQDIIDILGWESKPKETIFQTDLFLDLTDEEQKIVAILKDKGVLHIDAITNLVNMSISVLSVHLFNLEIKNVIRSISGKRYELV